MKILTQWIIGILVIIIMIIAVIVSLQIKKYCYKRKCLVIFEDFRENVKIGMISNQITRALKDTEWIKKSHIRLVSIVGGSVSLEFNSSSLRYIISLYPDENNRSDYTICFRLSKSQKVYKEWKKNQPTAYADKIIDYESDLGRRFISGKLKDDTVILQEYALCSPDYLWPLRE